MYLKRIELQGFKSFPEKIRLEFNRGITAVVGPNGSGKSNIADAVRWVLGEQSAKSLRGVKMEDIIFAGTANRRQLGFAEVVLIIDNSDRRLDIEFSEISVTRRVYRSGESEYQINGSNCRLRDIHEMFMDTGVGKEGYSVIGQGRIEEILSARSEDRRMLFEEAAGIVKYKNRKHETEQKLERERMNLVRVGDIIAELESQLEPLRKQSETARAYLALKERLKLLQVNVFLLNADKAGAEVKALDENISALEQQIAAQKTRQEECIAAIAEMRIRVDELTEQLRLTEGHLSEARVAAEGCEGEARLNTEQINNISADIERLSAEADEAKGRAAALNESLTRERERLSDIELRLSQAEHVLGEKQAAFEDVSRRMNEGEQRIEQFNAQIISRVKAVADTRAAAQKSQALYERLQEQKEELNDSSELNRSKAAENKARLAELESSLAEREAESAKAEADIEQLLTEKDENSSKLHKLTDEVHALQKSLNESASRHKLLAELERGYEGYLKSVRAVLMRKERFSGICGAAAELLEVEPKYETCIEVALGAAAQNIITRSEEDASAAIEYLKTNREGRATFLPLTAIKPREPVAERVLSEPGVCGTAKGLIKYDGLYENVFSNLLGRVIVVDSLSNAVRLARKYNHTYKIVTLEGELLSAGGAMTGGSSHKVMSLFSRGREMKELKRKTALLTDKIGAAEASARAVSEQLGIIKAQIEQKRAALQQTALDRASLSQLAGQARELALVLTTEAEELESKNKELMQRILAVNKELRGCELEISENEDKIKSLHEQLDAFQSTMINEKEEKEEGIRELLAAKAEISALEQNVHAARANIERMASEASEAREEADRHLADREARLLRKRQSEERLDGIRQRAAELKRYQSELDMRHGRLTEERSRKSEELSHIEAEEREIISVLSGLSAENIRLGMKREQTMENSRRLYDEMWDEYGITYHAALLYERLELPAAQLARDERALKAEIQGLGDVNVGAIEEYRHVKERYEFLTRQRDDIISAEDKLNAIISELTDLMERQFTEQFKLISQNFAYVFREMFGGGDAYLKLLDEKNVLEAGIEIVARPPGKTLQSMSLLSGGERALTATALLFGILRMKPSPFCILDEVEAALDDSNVIRYANYLRNFSKETQFILITHRKATMEAADTLYGVTMQEQGISKLVSVKFGDE